MSSLKRSRDAAGFEAAEELRGFGAFSAKQREARTGRNPRTGAAVAVDGKAVPYFKPGKELRERVNGGAPQAPPRKAGKPV